MKRGKRRVESEERLADLETGRQGKGTCFASASLQISLYSPLATRHSPLPTKNSAISFGRGDSHCTHSSLLGCRNPSFTACSIGRLA